MKKILLFAIVLLLLTHPKAQAQGYIDCATVLNDSEFPTIEFSVAKNGYFYVALETEYYDAPVKPLRAWKIVGHFQEVIIISSKKLSK